MTKNAIDKTELEKAAKTIMASDRILIYGLGNSAAVALDFQHKLFKSRMQCGIFFRQSHAGYKFFAPYVF